MEVAIKYANDNIIVPYKNREINLNRPVLVYKNSDNGKWSIKQFGLVVAHGERLCLSNFTTVVNRQGRQRVLASGQKNVHAYIKGYYSTSGCGTTAKNNDLPIKIKYNPFEYEFFFQEHCGYIFKIKSGMFCIFDEEGVKGAYLNTTKII